MPDRVRSRRALLAVFLLAACCFTVAIAPSASAATIRVDTHDDELNDDADCSLREAVVAVNTSAPVSGCPAGDPTARDVIRLGVGAYVLDEPGFGENESATGDLDLTSPVTVRGAGMDVTVVNGGGLDRVFEISVPATLTDLIVTGSAGHGVLAYGQEVLLDHVAVVGADGGHGIANGGSLAIRDSRINGNGLHGISTNVASEFIAITRSTIYENAGSGLNLEYGETVLENVTLAENDEHGLYVDSDAEVEMRHTTVGINDQKTGVVYGSLTASSSIFADPGPNDACDVDVGASVTSMGFNIDQDGTCLEGNGTMTDPELRPLGEYGGPAPTLALKPGSPAINNSFEDCVKSDARGVPRPQAKCDTANINLQDLGAYELTRCAGGIVNRVGTPGPDVMLGGSSTDVFLGLGGNDRISGDVGNDRACGGPGNDTIKGQDGNDKLLGQQGNDNLTGGPGTDTCIGGPGSDSASTCEKRRSL